MNTRKTASVIFFLMLISASLVLSAFAQIPVTTGVSQGDSFKYDVEYIWRSTNPANVVPSDWVSNNETDYLQITVDAASGTSLRISSVWHYKNGTQSNPIISIVEVGNSTINGFDFFYAANLSVGSSLFPLITDLPYTINSTSFRTYKENDFTSTRATNNIIVNRTDLPNHVYSLNDLFFDKTTGVLVEDTITEVFTATPTQTFITHITLVESSLWEISQAPTSQPTTSTSTTVAPGQTNSPAPTQDGTETPTAESFDMLLIVLVIIFVVIIVIIIFVLLTRRPKTARKPTTPPTVTENKTATTTTPVAPGIVRCSNCGYENPEFNEFCGKCGKRIQK